MTWDIPGAIKESAPLVRDLIRIVVPDAAERGARQEVDARSKKQRAIDAWKDFRVRMRDRSLARRLAAERDRAELEKLFNPEDGPEPPS